MIGDEIFGPMDLKYQVVGSHISHCPSSFETNSTDFQTVLYLGKFLQYSVRGFAFRILTVIILKCPNLMVIVISCYFGSFPMS